jgi:hypothetical protein
MGNKSTCYVSNILIILFTATSVFAAGEGLDLLKQQYMNTIDMLSNTSSAPIPNSRLVLNNAPVNRPQKVLNNNTEVIKETPKFESKTYSFNKSSVWGDIQVNLTSYEKYFTVKIKSTAPIVYYKIVDINDVLLCEKSITQKDVSNTSFNTNFVYMPAYKLMLNVKAEDTVNTVSIPLYSKYSIVK